jgi:hypothetical protein
VEEAESACRTAQARLEALLAQAGLLPTGAEVDDLASMLTALAPRSVEAAVHRRNPPSGEALQQAEAELAEARVALAAHGRPEWDDRPATIDAPLPDRQPLLEERARLFEEAYGIERSLPDVGRIQDKREVLVRHIATLEAASRTGSLPKSVEEAEMVLLGRVADARRAGPGGEAVPILVDDAFAAFGAEDRCDLLDLLSRLAETTQIVYLTDDRLTLEWASARGEQGDVGTVLPPGAAPPPIASVA